MTHSWDMLFFLSLAREACRRLVLVGLFVFLIIFLYLCLRRELAVKAAVQADSHWRSFSPFLLINDGASPKSGEDDSTWARSALSPPRDYFQ